MFVALDSNGKRVYADEVEKDAKCFCPVCGEPVTLHRGTKWAYFEHHADTSCQYGGNDNSNNKWHLKMQSYFPKETRDVCFEDKLYKTVNVADVYLADSNTVLQFQHSYISSKEFQRITKFHLFYGRRIVWLMDESYESKEFKEKHARDFFRVHGKLQEMPKRYKATAFPYGDRTFRWVHRRRDLYLDSFDLHSMAARYSLCFYLGDEGDVFHRVVDQKEEHYGKFDNVTLSAHDIALRENMDAGEFFADEPYWLEKEPWKNRVEKHQDEMAYRELLLENIPSIYLPHNPDMLSTAVLERLASR